MASKRLSLVLAFIIALSGLMFVSAPQAVSAQDAKTLVVGFAQEPDSMNGFYSSMAFAQWANDLVQASLWDYSDTLEPVLVLAAEVPTVANGGINADYTEYTIKLKPNLKWSDGEALNADDLVFTFQMIEENKTNNFLQAGSIADAVEAIEKVDDLTFRLKFNAPKPFAEDIAGSPGLSTILPEHIFRPVWDAEKSIENAKENQDPTVFSGPYVLKEWKRGESMLFEANPSYVLGAPKIANVLLRFFPDTESQYAALAAGQLDFVPNISEGDKQKVAESSADIKQVTVFGGYIESLWLNLRDEKTPRAGHPALKDVNVRRALRMGINRKAITDTLLAGTTSPTDSIYSSSPFEKKDLGVVAYDKEGAMKMLDEAGWKVGADGVREKDGVKMELRYSTTNAGWRNNIQAVIQQQLAEIGVKVILEIYPASEFFGSWANNGINAVGNYDIAQYANNTALTNESNVTVIESLNCEQFPSETNEGGQNFTGFCSKDMDAAAKVTLTSLKAEERLAAAYKIQEIMRDEAPLINLFPRGDNYAYIGKNFKGAIRVGSGVGNQWFDILNWELNK